MSRLPIRLRLTLVFAVGMAVVIGGVGGFVYVHLANDLSRALDQELRSRAQDVSALVAHGGSLRATDSTLIERGESFAEFLDARGAVLDATPLIGDERLLRDAELARALREPLFANRESVPGLDEPARMLAVPVERNGRRAVLVVGATRENRAETLASLRAGLLIGGPLALLLASLCGYWLAGTALRPIETMRRRAEEISTSSIDERLPVPRARDEVRRLGETLNAMLARIDDGIARERRFVADASHELRTPLASLRTELDLAMRRSRSADELEAVIRSAAAESERLARIADDLLLLAHSEQGKLPIHLEPTDVNDVLESVAVRFAVRAEAEGRIVSTDTSESLVALTDRLRLEQAIGNLVDNALSHGGGCVVLSAAGDAASVEVHVTDEGPGFPASFLERAFDRFSRADDARRRRGSGLGLAIVDTVASAHRGTAHAANRVGGGADVWITLPRT
jgi:two-component system OmpR family sensor kinase